MAPRSGSCVWLLVELSVELAAGSDLLGVLMAVLLQMNVESAATEAPKR